MAPVVDIDILPSPWPPVSFTDGVMNYHMIRYLEHQCLGCLHAVKITITPSHEGSPISYTLYLAERPRRILAMQGTTSFTVNYNFAQAMSAFGHLRRFVLPLNTVLSVDGVIAVLLASPIPTSIL